MAVVHAELVMLSHLLSAPRIPFAEVSDTRSSLCISHQSCTDGKRSSLIDVDSEEGPRCEPNASKLKVLN